MLSVNSYNSWFNVFDTEAVLYKSPLTLHYIISLDVTVELLMMKVFCKQPKNRSKLLYKHECLKWSTVKIITQFIRSPNKNFISWCTSLLFQDIWPISLGKLWLTFDKWKYFKIFQVSTNKTKAVMLSHR